MMFPTDHKTLALVGAAVAAPWLLGFLVRAGAPIPVYVTGGQRNALAAFPSTVAGVAHAQTGNVADDASFVARVQEIKRALVASKGHIAGGDALGFALVGIPADSSDEATEVANALAVAAVAGQGAAASGGWQNVPTILKDWQVSTGDAYSDALNADITAAQAGSWLDADDASIRDAWRAVEALASAMDAQGFIVSGRPVTYGLTDIPGLAADWWKEEGPSFGLSLLTSTPVLLVVGGLVLWKVLT